MLNRRPSDQWAVLALAIACIPHCAASSNAQSTNVQTIAFQAASVGRELKFRIVLPESYEVRNETRYPVLYMLHGLTSNYTAWSVLGAPRAAQRYDLIVVMADAGNSWYVNWAESEPGQKNDWEDCIIKDLIPHVDEHYRTIAKREGRAITGLSMGGYGALTLGLRHPDLFCSIGSQSGAIAFAKRMSNQLKKGVVPAGRIGREPSDRPNPAIGIEGFSSQLERTPKGKIFTTFEQAEAHDPFSLVLTVPSDKLPHIYIDCGTEDRLIDGNHEFIRLLIEHDIPFTFSQSAGGHLPLYWAREVSHDIAVQYEFLRRNLQRDARSAARARTSDATNSPPP
jgi:S-formylglutathione hydrolase FrmB